MGRPKEQWSDIESHYLSTKIKTYGESIHKHKIGQWELVLGEVLHAIRCLLCTAVNETPYEHMFKH